MKPDENRHGHTDQVPLWGGFDLKTLILARICSEARGNDLKTMLVSEAISAYRCAGMLRGNAVAAGPGPPGGFLIWS